MHSWVPKTTEFCFSLIIVLLTQRTHFLEMSKFYFFQPTVPASSSLYIWVPSVHLSTVTDGCRHGRWGTGPGSSEGEAECVACTELNSRSLSVDNTNCNQELLFEAWF
jgi:hypothetical protein